MLDLEELERLAKAATPGPWVGRGNHIFCANNKRLVYVEAERALDLQTAAYIVAACNSLPDLIAENRALQERVRELERQRDWLAKRLARFCHMVDDEMCGGCTECNIEIADCASASSQNWMKAAEKATKEDRNDGREEDKSGYIPR